MVNAESDLDLILLGWMVYDPCVKALGQALSPWRVGSRLNSVLRTRAKTRPNLWNSHLMKALGAAACPAWALGAVDGAIDIN